MTDTLKFSGQTTAYEHKHGDKWKASPGHGDECLKLVKFLDVQWSNCPVEIEDVVKQMWTRRELGNDNYILKTDFDQLDEAIAETDEDPTCHTTRCYDRNSMTRVERQINYRLLKDFLVSKGVNPGETVYIHWWW